MAAKRALDVPSTAPSFEQSSYTSLASSAAIGLNCGASLKEETTRFPSSAHTKRENNQQKGEAVLLIDLKLDSSFPICLLFFFRKLGTRGPSDVTVGDVSQLWAALGLEPNRLDDLLELVSIATTTPATPPPPPPKDEPKDAEGGEETAKEHQPRYDPATVVEWNKLLALAAGQLGDVNRHLGGGVESYKNVCTSSIQTCWQMARLFLPSR